MAQIIESKKSVSQKDDIGTSILDSLKQIKSSYDSKIPQIDYSKIQNLPSNDVFMPTTDAIRAEATNGLANYKSASLDKINNDFKVEMQTQQAKKQNLKNQFDQQVASINTNAQNSLEKLQAKNISQGIENSSITNNTKQAINNQQTADLNGVQKEYQSTLDAIALKCDICQQEKELALANFDIAYANKLNQQINTLTSQYNTALKNAEEYQNLIDQKRTEIEKEFDSKYGATVESLTQNMHREMTYDAFVKLKDLPKSQAQEILNSNPEIKEYLGDWYSALTLWLNR